MKLFLAPHNDDETLFAAFTLMREKPLVVVITDSHVQWNRGDGITADQRWRETMNACRVLDCACYRLGMRDDTLNEADLEVALRSFSRFSQVFSPALQGGHAHHDIVCRTARRVFSNVLTEYCTYGGEGHKQFYANEGARRIDGTAEEHRVKALALAEYPSQMGRSHHHFTAVKSQPEWMTP